MTGDEPLGDEPLSDTRGDHTEFHHNTFSGTVIGVQHHHHYPPAPPPRAPGQIVEGDIPQRPPGFQPREELLHQLNGLLGGETSVGGAVVICAVAGTPGVGKTMLAASYAWSCQAAGWPVIAWIAAETTDQILTGLAGLAERLGERRPDDDTTAAAARAKAWLAATTSPALLVFDNATDVSTVRSWCPATGATRVVITTRNRAFLRAYQPLEVEVFAPAQAAGFLHERTGLTDPAGAEALAAELGHLPLALAQAAAVIVRLRLDYTGYLDLLRTFPLADYLPAQDGDPYPAGTAQAILLSVTQTEEALPAARQVLPILAVLSPAGVPVTMLYGLSDDDENPQVRVREMLADLADTSLISFTEDGSAVLMHRLVQRVLRERAAHHGDLDTAIDQATALLHDFNVTLPDEHQLWRARAAVETLVEQTDTLYQHAHTRDALTADLLELRGWCGRYLTELADLTRAIPLFERTLADCERVLGPDHAYTLTFRNNLAGAYKSAGDLTHAIPLLEHTLADCERVLGPDHPNTLTSRNNLASAYQEAGHPAHAIPLYERTLTDCERVLGPDHPNTLTSRNNLASAYQEAGHPAHAIPLYERTLADSERVLGPDHPTTLTSRNNLANAYLEAGDLTHAIPLHERTLADCERVLGPDHPNTLTSRNNLANAYLKAGDLTHAIPLYERTLADSERVLGPDHPNTLTSRNNLANAYLKAGDLTHAIPLLEHTLADCERVLGPDHPTTRVARGNLEVARKASAQKSSEGWRRWLPGRLKDR